MMFFKPSLYFIIFLIASNVPCYGQDEEQRAIDYLQSLEIEDLIHVEVVLDEVFNVFDGLIKSRKINVATGSQQTTERAPAITTAITAQDIEATGATNLEEVLESVPGLHVSRLFFGYDPRYTLRGISSLRNPEILMMINGIAIKTLYDANRGMIWRDMPVNAISRIEIIRGPASAVFGADAFSGVINIITKTREDINGTEVGARMGSFNTQDAWFLHGKQYGDLDAVATLEYHTTKGHQGLIEADAQTQFDSLFGTTASLAPGAVNLQEHNVDARLDLFWKGWRLRTGYQGRRDMGNGAGAAGALDPYAAWTDDRLNIDLTYYLNPQFTQYWDMTAQLSYFSTATDLEKTQRLFPSGAFGGSYPDGFIGNPGLSERHTRFDLSGFYSGFNNHLIRIGSGYYYGDLYKVTETKNFGVDPQTGEPLPPGASLVATTDTPFVFIPEKYRKNSYLFLQDLWKLSPSWELTAGIRYDKYSDFGSTVNPRAAIVWQTLPELTTKLLYGNAFRAPSIAELYVANNPAQLGNPNLKPESIETWELAGDYRVTRDLYLALNFFTYKITDKIIYVPDPEVEGARAQNAGNQEGRGLEFEIRWKPTLKSSILLNYAFQDSVDEYDHLVPIAPRHSGYLRADWLVTGYWFLDANLNWVADRPRAFDDPRPQVDDYAIVNLSLRYKDVSRKDWNFALGVRNLFDTDAREPSDPSANIPNDLPLAGRSYFLELRYQF